MAGMGDEAKFYAEEVKFSYFFPAEANLLLLNSIAQPVMSSTPTRNLSL